MENINYTHNYKMIILLAIGLALTIGTQCVEVAIHPEGSCDSNVLNSSISVDCQSLDSVLQDIQSNTTLRLSAGVYMIRTNYTILNKSDVSIIGLPDNPKDVIIECEESYGLVFINVQRLYFNGLTVCHCGFKGTDRVNATFLTIKMSIAIFYEPLSDFSTALLLVDIQDLVMKNVTITENEGFGMVCINIIGESELSNVNLTFNYPATCQLDASKGGGSGGGLLLLHQDYIDQSKNQLARNTTFLFENGHIEHNYNCRPDLFAVQYNKLSRSLDPHLAFNNSIIGSGGITVIFGQSEYGANATFDQCNLTQNSGLYHSAGMELTLFQVTSNSHIHVTNSLFYQNGGFLSQKPELTNTMLDPFGAIVATFYTPIPSPLSNTDLKRTLLFQNISSIHLLNCLFQENTAKSGAGVTVLSFGPANGFVENRMYIKRCTFLDNHGDYGSAIFITEISYSAFESGLLVIIERIEAARNQRIATSAISSFQSETTAVVDINYVNVSFVGFNVFARNQHTALSAYSAIITMSGNNFFLDNVGTTGGAMHLQTESYLVLDKHSFYLHEM